jgi:hypothetical protein
MNEAGDIIQGTYGHAAKMEALTPDTPTLNKPYIFTCGCETD